MHLAMVIGRTFGGIEVAEKPAWMYSRRVLASTIGAVECHERVGELGDDS